MPCCVPNSWLIRCYAGAVGHSPACPRGAPLVPPGTRPAASDGSFDLLSVGLVEVQPTGTGKAGWGRVRHPVAELHVVRRRAVLMDVEAFELAVLRHSEVPLALDRADGEHHHQSNRGHQD